jgi:hypothetical protein
VTASSIHLAKRALGSLVPVAPRRGDVDWVEGILSAQEAVLWRRMARADRRHSVTVARRVETTLSATEHADDARWAAAALLHDLGKLDADLGVPLRVLATLVARIGGYERVAGWTRSRGLRRRFALYVRHPELGATRLALAGSAPEVVTWARMHQNPVVTNAGAPVPGIPPAVVNALLAADDD